jgi:hypothetical protein
MGYQHTWKKSKEITSLNAYYEERLKGNEPPVIKMTTDKLMALCSEMGILKRLEEAAPELLAQIRIYDLRSLDDKYWMFIQSDEGADGTELLSWVMENKRTEDEERFAKCMAHVTRRMERMRHGLSVD